MLNWRTYNALPRLRSYQEALAHFNTVQPIRGDANGTKPVGRRDQKWLAIYMRDDKTVCIGSYWNREKCKALLAYHPDGRVAIETSISAACRERIQRIAGLTIQRRYNEDWVAAAAYADGEEVIGHYPLKLSHNGDRKAVFILHGNKVPTYLNPTPTYKHTINRQEKAKLTKQYKPFLEYVSVMAKLSASEPDISPWSKETKDNPRMPESTAQERKELGLLPTYSLRWSPEAKPAFLKLVDSGETEDWYKAMTWLSTGYWRMYLNEAKREVINIVHHEHRDTLFTKERVSAGKLVYDRYGRYFR